MQRKPLTIRQERAYRILVDFVKMERRPPSYSELGLRLGYSSPSSVKKMLDQLENKGWVRRQDTGKVKREVWPVDVKVPKVQI